MIDPQVSQTCIAILKEDLVPALGCTEPIAVAYAAARAREALGCFPEHISAACSGNIVKNVQGVIVPGTGDLRGTKAAAILGTVGGAADRELEVLSTTTPEDVARTRELLKTDLCTEELLHTPARLHIIIRMEAGGHTSMAEIIHSHANIVRVEKDGIPLVDIPHAEELTEEAAADPRESLSVADIVRFATEGDMEPVRETLERQISCNTAIARAGLTEGYGVRTGPALLKIYGHGVQARAKAAAAAASDARMSGCELPVVINSGSGNQGLTVSLPVIEYAEELGVSRDRLYRALCISNLCSAHQKSKIGKLSAFCGAVSAAAGAGAGICYLLGGGEREIEMTLINTLGNVSGLVCDGAKPSCAAKIASSLDAAILGAGMALEGRCFHTGEGIVRGDVEVTMDCVARMARNGMSQTDSEVLRIMVDD